MGYGWSPVPIHEARQQWYSAQHILSLANVQGGEVRAACSMVENWHSVPLHQSIGCQQDGAEESQGEFSVLPLVPEGARLAYCASKEELRFGVPQDYFACQIQISLDIEGLKRTRRRIVS